MTRREPVSLDLRVYLVTGEATSATAVETIISAAASGGVTAVQLRDKDGSTTARTSAARQLASVLEPLAVPLLLNDDVEAARMAGVAGVHVGPDDLHPTQARAILGPDAVIGWSVHHIRQLSDTEAVDACDYLAAGPVWPTLTKRDTAPPLGLDGVRALRAAMPRRLPLIGIGGITAENAGDLIRAGADGIAVVSAIWSAPNPAHATQRLREIVDTALAERNRR
ncbi:MAG TPA: thiamine phosphate synthase [Thermomicrobiales bacterium]|nr:thiamine phosphate synthase [Thermomicrobiales bacterium]